MVETLRDVVESIAVQIARAWDERLEEAVFRGRGATALTVQLPMKSIGSGGSSLGWALMVR